MKITLKIEIDVNPRWYRSAVAVAGVPGRADEAREELCKLVGREVQLVLAEAAEDHQPVQWDRVKVAHAISRRPLRAHRYLK